MHFRLCQTAQDTLPLVVGILQCTQLMLGTQSLQKPDVPAPRRFLFVYSFVFQCLFGSP